MAEIVFLVDVDAPLAKVRDALATNEGLVSWWTADAIGSGEVGSVLSLGFPDAPARFSLRVDEVADNGVGWTSVGDFPPHWNGTKIAFGIMDNPDAGGSRVFFEHNGFAAADPMTGHTAFTWANLMNSLKAFCETGRADPYFDPLT